MIDIENVNVGDGTATWCCPECEAAYWVPVQITIHYASKSRLQRYNEHLRMKRFTQRHGKCGEAELDARLAGYFKTTPGANGLVQKIYDAQPGIRFAEVAQIFDGLMEMRKSQA